MSGGWAVFAHGLVGRADLPIPAELFGAAAAGVLAISFAALAAGWSAPRLEQPRERRLFAVPRVADVLAGAVGVAVFAAVVWAGFAGSDGERDNLAPTAIYVIFWVGLPFVSLVLGDVFRALSPWRAIGRAGGWLLARTQAAGASEPLPYPERLGRWPAVAGLVLFAIAELCWAQGRDPQVLAVLAVLYCAVQLVGMSVYGVEPWSRNGDAFGVYFGLFASLAPLARRDDGVLVARPPATGAPALNAVPGTVALLVVAVATTTFDGAKEGPLFNDLAPRLQDFFTSLGLSKGTALELAFVVGLALALALVAAVFHLGVAGMPKRPGLAGRFVGSLIPITAAYVVAHYFSLLAYQGQAAYALASDPLGDGSDLFGTAARAIDYGVVSATAIWYVQVGALVAGHVTALVLAHDRALAVYGSPRAAARSQAVMLMVMIAFTSLGLWLLSAANA